MRLSDLSGIVSDVARTAPHVPASGTPVPKPLDKYAGHGRSMSPLVAALRPTSARRAAAFADDPRKGVTSITFAFPDVSGAAQKITQNVDLKASAEFGIAPMRATVEDEAALQKILPTTVRIMAKSASGSGKWFGSGSIVAPSSIVPGYKAKDGEYFILTNNHVADGASHLTIRFPNGVEHWAEVVRSPGGAELKDAAMDVAILRVTIPMSLPTATIGDSEELRIGQTIYTAGYPQAIPMPVITKGVVSQPAQETGELSLDIESDAPINPGNSGGPMFNERGEIVGLNTYTFRGAEDFTFAKPVGLQLQAINTIWKKGEIVRGSLNFGVKGFPLIDRKLAGFPENLTGALVSSVEMNSGAEKAGLKKDDVITDMEAYDAGGRFISYINIDVDDAYESSGQIGRWTASLPPGATVNATVYRKTAGKYQRRELSIVVDKLEPKVEVTASSWGLTVSEGDAGELIISAVDKGSPAEAAGLSAGRYYLQGIDSDVIPAGLRPLAQNLHSMYKLDDLLELLENRYAEEIIITVADIENPAKTRRLRLRRPIE